MNKHLSGIVAVLLVPCLSANAALASAPSWREASRQQPIATADVQAFQQEAFIERGLWQLQSFARIPSADEKHGAGLLELQPAGLPLWTTDVQPEPAAPGEAMRSNDPAPVASGWGVAYIAIMPEHATPAKKPGAAYVSALSGESLYPATDLFGRPDPERRIEERIRGPRVLDDIARSSGDQRMAPMDLPLAQLKEAAGRLRRENLFGLSTALWPGKLMALALKGPWFLAQAVASDEWAFLQTECEQAYTLALKGDVAALTRLVLVQWGPDVETAVYLTEQLTRKMQQYKAKQGLGNGNARSQAKKLLDPLIQALTLSHKEGLFRKGDAEARPATEDELEQLEKLFKEFAKPLYDLFADFYSLPSSRRKGFETRLVDALALFTEAHRTRNLTVLNDEEAPPETPYLTAGEPSGRRNDVPTDVPSDPSAIFLWATGITVDAQAVLNKPDSEPNLRQAVEGLLQRIYVVVIDPAELPASLEYLAAPLKAVYHRLAAKLSWMEPWIQQSPLSADETRNQEAAGQAAFERTAAELKTLLEDAPAFYESIAPHPAAQTAWNHKHDQLERFGEQLQRWLSERRFPQELIDAHVAQGYRIAKLPHQFFLEKSLKILGMNHLEASLRHRITEINVTEAARIAFQTACFDLVCLFMMRVGAGGEARVAANRLTMDDLLRHLQSGQGFFKTRFVDNSAGLVDFPTAEFSWNETIQVRTQERLISWFAHDDGPNPHSLRYVYDLGRHLRGVRSFVDSRHALREKRFQEDLWRHRFINTVDYSLMIVNLIPLLEYYEKHPDDDQVAQAIAAGLSGDPELFLNRAELERLHPGEPEVRYDKSDPHFYPSQLPPGTLDRYFGLIEMHRRNLAAHLRAHPPAEPELNYLPFGRNDAYPHWLLMTMLLGETVSGEKGRFTYDDYNRSSADPAVFARIRANDRFASFLFPYADRYDSQEAVQVYNKLLQALERDDHVLPGSLADASLAEFQGRSTQVARQSETPYQAVDWIVQWPNLTAIQKKRPHGAWQKEFAHGLPFQSTVPDHAGILEKLHMQPGDKVLVIAGYSGDWAQALAQAGAEVIYSDIDRIITQIVLARSQGVFRAVRTADPLLEPSAPNEYDWTFSYEPIPLEPDELPWLLLRSLLNRKGGLLVYRPGFINEGLHKLIDDFRQTYGPGDPKTNESFESPGGAIEWRTISLRVQRPSELSFHEEPLSVIHLGTSETLRTKARRDLAYIEALQSYQGQTPNELLQHIANATGVSLSLNELQDTARRITSLTTLVSDGAKHSRRIGLTIAPANAMSNPAFRERPIMGAFLMFLSIPFAAWIPGVAGLLRYFQAVASLHQGFLWAAGLIGAAALAWTHRKPLLAAA